MSALGVLEGDDLLSVVQQPSHSPSSSPPSTCAHTRGTGTSYIPTHFNMFSTWTRTVTHAAAWARGRILGEDVVLVPMNGDSADER